MSIKTECYWDNIPEKYKLKIIELYESPYCTLEYIESFYKCNTLNCFSIYDEDKLIHVIIFVINQKNKKVDIINRLLTIDIKYLNIFSDFIFKLKPRIDLIHIDHIANLIHQKNLFHYICKPFGEDFIINLPTSKDEYFSKFSFNQRDHTKRSIRKIERTFKYYSINTFEKEEISIDLIYNIIEMNHLRMEEKKIISDIDESYTKSIIQFVKNFGYVSVLEIEGKIVAGVILYLIGNKFFLETISHDPSYNQYSVGHICLYLTILNCIDIKGKEFHLLWGDSRYKRSFLGDKFPLYSVTIFRSKLNKQIFKFVCEFLPNLSVKSIYLSLKRRIKQIPFVQFLLHT